MDQQTPPALPPQNSGWYHRNWKWFVPVLCVAALLLIAGGILGIITIVMSAMKSTTPYQTALADAKADARVANAIGQPMQEDWLFTGQIQTAGYIILAGAVGIITRASRKQFLVAAFIAGIEALILTHITPQLQIDSID